MDGEKCVQSQPIAPDPGTIVKLHGCKADSWAKERKYE